MLPLTARGSTVGAEPLWLLEDDDLDGILSLSQVIILLNLIRNLDHYTQRVLSPQLRKLHILPPFPRMLTLLHLNQI